MQQQIRNIAAKRTVSGANAVSVGVTLDGESAVPTNPNVAPSSPSATVDHPITRVAAPPPATGGRQTRGATSLVAPGANF